MTGALKDLIKIRRHMINLGILLYMWMASSFNSYLISFELKYLHGDIFHNSMVSFCSEVPFVLMGGYIYHKFGIRVVFTGAFLIALVGGLSLLFASEDYPDLATIMVTFARDGVKATFDICYLSNALIFPAIFAGTAYGVCNIGAKTVTILSPMLAELNPPVPMIVFSSVALIAIVLAQFIRVPDHK